MNVTFMYALCFLFRFLEYFLLRTDETFWGEAFVHKLIGIVILFIAVKHYGFKFAGIGLTENNVWRRLSEGLAFGLLVFVPAYLAEVMIAIVQGEFEGLELYVSAYSVHGTMGKQTGFLFFVICILGNMINVMMEEGIFRGLFQKMLEKKYSFATASAIASGLFGLWHIMAPVRSYCDGTMSGKGFVSYSVLLIITSGLAGFQFALMTRLTRNLYMAMGYHFVNNVIVNILHVVSATGTDQFMVVRISIAQTVSFVIILIWYVTAALRE